MHDLDVLYSLDPYVRHELGQRIASACDEDQPLLRLTIDGLERVAVEDRCSLYELMDGTRHSLLEMHGLDLCEWRRALAECPDDLFRLTGEPGTALSLLWNLDVALGMVEMFFAAGTPAQSALTQEVQRATAQAWDRHDVEMALIDCDVPASAAFAEA